MITKLKSLNNFAAFAPVSLVVEATTTTSATSFFSAYSFAVRRTLLAFCLQGGFEIDNYFFSETHVQHKQRSILEQYFPFSLRNLSAHVEPYTAIFLMGFLLSSVSQILQSFGS